MIFSKRADLNIKDFRNKDAPENVFIKSDVLYDWEIFTLGAHLYVEEYEEHNFVSIILYDDEQVFSESVSYPAWITEDLELFNQAVYKAIEDLIWVRKDAIIQDILSLHESYDKMRDMHYSLTLLKLNKKEDG